MDVDSVEDIVEIMHKLEKIDGIRHVSPHAYNPDPDDNWYDASPNDSHYLNGDNTAFAESDQWALDRIEVEKVWDFTTGTGAVK